MNGITFGAVVAAMIGVFGALSTGNPDYLRVSGGVIALCSAVGAILLFTRSAEINDAENQLESLESFVPISQRAAIVATLKRKDRIGQLTLILLAAVGVFLQSTADFLPLVLEILSNAKLAVEAAAE